MFKPLTLYLYGMITRISSDIHRAKSALDKGQAIGIPTETVYGLAANALNPAAVESIFQIKGRPHSNPLILHFFDVQQARPYIQDFDPELQRIMEVFSPGPITFLVPKTKAVPSLITAGLDKVAIRFPSQPLLRRLLSLLDFPLAAPSANKYGAVSPTLAQQVKEQLSGEIPLVLDGGPCGFGLESTIVGMEGSKAVVYRLGSVPLDDLAVVLGYIPTVKNHKEEQPMAPGMVKYHYAPTTPLHYFSPTQNPSTQCGYLFLQQIPKGFDHPNSIALSTDGNLKTVAQNLYSMLIEMDSRGYSKLYIEKPKPEGIGLTIIDRLNRATAKYNP